jgi:hypothetical protein
MSHTRKIQQDCLQLLNNGFCSCEISDEELRHARKDPDRFNCVPQFSLLTREIQNAAEFWQGEGTLYLGPVFLRTVSTNSVGSSTISPSKSIFSAFRSRFTVFADTWPSKEFRHRPRRLRSRRNFDHENRLPNIAILDVSKRWPPNNKTNNIQRHPGISMAAYSLRILSEKALAGSSWTMA